MAKAADKRGGIAAQYTRADAVRRVPLTIAVDAETKVSGVLALPKGPVARPLAAAVVLGHGAGANMNQALLVAFQEGLAARGAAVLRFNFVYTEAAKRAPDRPPLLIAAFRAAAKALAARPEAKGRVLVLGGKSMGGRIASHVAALGDAADGLVFLGYPLHPAGQPKKMRDAHLSDVPCPMLFLEGTRDPLCDLTLLRPVLERIGPRASLHVIEGGDHSFAVPRASGRTPADVTEELIGTTAEWLATLKAARRPPAKDAAASPPRVASRAPSSSTPRGGTRTPATGRAPRK